MKTLLAALYARRHEVYLGVAAVLATDQQMGAPHLTWKIGIDLASAFLAGAGITAVGKAAKK